MLEMCLVMFLQPSCHCRHRGSDTACGPKAVHTSQLSSTLGVAMMSDLSCAAGVSPPVPNSPVSKTIPTTGGQAAVGGQPTTAGGQTNKAGGQVTPNTVQPLNGAATTGQAKSVPAGSFSPGTPIWLTSSHIVDLKAQSCSISQDVDSPYDMLARSQQSLW